ncbi:MAG: phosphatase PAP2 family protein [Sulfuricurvum sp.]|nr:phosphatase PAP2 family protein [Sulfuricurvum sp.]MDD5385967.1 phosphatase PAP2 family protein [Sulfuricurvum sp.]
MNICGNIDQIEDGTSFIKNLALRLWANWCLKAVGTMGFIALFFSLYFYLLTHHFFPVTQIPLTPVDGWISFNDFFLYFYLSLWVYVSLPPALMKSKKELFYYGAYVGIVSVIGILFYLFFPTVIPQNSHDWAASSNMKLLKSVDLGGNAFPSLHVATAFFSFFWLNLHLKEMQGAKIIIWLNALWCFGIVYSTIAIKQHVFLDVLGGLILGGVMAFFTLRHHRKAF